MNDRLFINALKGLTEEQFEDRLSDHNNPIQWIATHTVWARFNAAAFLGSPVSKNPYDGLFENFRPYSKEMELPNLSEVINAWNNATVHLHQAFENSNDEILKAPSPIQSPIGDFSNRGTIMFLVQHESYDIGQMAFLKKYYTKEAMSYG